MAEVTSDARGAVRLLTLNRPDKRNAITSAMFRALTAAVGGHAVGVAFTLTLLCNLVYASTRHGDRARGRVVVAPPEPSWPPPRRRDLSLRRGPHRRSGARSRARQRGPPPDDVLAHALVRAEKLCSTATPSATHEVTHGHGPRRPRPSGGRGTPSSRCCWHEGDADGPAGASRPFVAGGAMAWHRRWLRQDVAASRQPGQEPPARRPGSTRRQRPRRGLVTRGSGDRQVGGVEDVGR